MLRRVSRRRADLGDDRVRRLVGPDREGDRPEGRVDPIDLDALLRGQPSPRRAGRQQQVVARLQHQHVADAVDEPGLVGALVERPAGVSPLAILLGQRVHVGIEAGDQAVVHAANGGGHLVPVEIRQDRVLQVRLEHHAALAEPELVVGEAVDVESARAGEREVVLPVVEDPVGDRFVGLEELKVQQDHRPVEHFARGRQPIAGQHVRPAVAAVVLDAQRPEAAEPLIGPRGHVRRVRAVAHPRDRAPISAARRTAARRSSR